MPKVNGYNNYRDTIINHKGIEVLNFVESHALLDGSFLTILVDTSSHINLKSLQGFHGLFEGTLQIVINIKRINDIRYINKFLEESNQVLSNDGLFIGHVEASNGRKSRILKKYPKPLNRFAYTLDFVINRVFPKFRLTKKIYFFITKGKNRVISEFETYGRLYSCGFELVDSKKIDGKIWFVAKKREIPAFNTEATYGLFIKLKRHGKNNQLFSVYKLRTMYPFSEYLQEYISSKQGLQKGGKFKNDPRITTAGRICRRFWLDELPMFINVLKGEMKLFGVRPLSNHYLSLYPDYMKDLRAKVKPGLVPPFYADLPETLDQIVESEEAYIKSYMSQPLLTDIKYFFKAAYNILIKKARSN
jgi:lipopolysaccharide/colanic/teichoic acid biosynthesis glycosyltransferase